MVLMDLLYFRHPLLDCGPAVPPGRLEYDGTDGLAVFQASITGLLASGPSWEVTASPTLWRVCSRPLETSSW